MRSGTTQRKLLSLAVAAVLVSTRAMPAAAQEGAPPEESTPPATASEEATTLSELVVTAQKREEAMQDVPISMTALPEQLLLDTGVRDIKDMQVLVPGLIVTSTQN